MDDFTTIDLKRNCIRFSVDEKVYPRDVSVACSYRFLDRCYVLLQRGKAGVLEVQLKGKRKLSKSRLTELAAEFENELLHQLMRQQVAQQTSGLREVLVGRALLSAEPLYAPESDTADPDSPTPEDQDLDYLDDPLGIAVPWEEKYGDDQDQDDPESKK